MEKLLKESKEFKLIFEKSLNILSGRYSSKIKGDGVEFVDLKEYMPGDDIRKIDWKVTAKLKKPFIKEFLEEKDGSHYVFLDMSGSMKNKFLKAKILATSLLLSSSKFRDSFSIGFFNSKEIIFFPQTKSKKELMRYVYEISKIDAVGGSGLKELLIKILNIISKKSIISIITDELELCNKTKSLILAIKKKHKLNYFHLYSSDEKNIEIGVNSFEDIETGDNGIFDLDEEDLIKYKEEYDKQIDEIKNNFLRIGIKPYIIDTALDLSVQIKKSGAI